MMGFACGCLVNAGFVLQLLHIFVIRNQGRLARFIFLCLLSLTGLACGFSTVLVVFLVVMKDGWHWGAFGLFAFWLGVSFAGSVFAFHQVAKKINPLLEKVQPA